MVGGSGLYTPNINTENIDYTPTTAEIGLGGVTLTATTDDPDGAGPCLSATDDISIVIATDVLVDAGIDEPVCSNLDIQLNGSFGGAATSAQWSEVMVFIHQMILTQMRCTLQQPQKLLVGH